MIICRVHQLFQLEPNLKTVMTKKPLLVAKLLGSKTNFIIAEAKRLSQISIIVNQSLDYQIAKHVYVSTANNGLLTLVVDSPVWATRLRYLHQPIISSLQNYSMTKSITQIKIKVRPLEYRTTKKTAQRKKLSLSRASAERMQEEIKAISDPTLQNTLKKLIRHAK